MRLGAGVDVVIATAFVKLDGLEEFFRAPTREYGDPICRGVDLAGGIRNDSLHVPIETVTLRGTRRPGPGESFEFAMQIRRRVGRAARARPAECSGTRSPPAT